MINKVVYDWFNLLINRNFNEWIKGKFTKREAIASLLIISVISFLIVALVSNLRSIESNTLKSLLELPIGIIEVFLFIWILPTAVKSIYKKTKTKYNLFTNFIRLSAFLVALSLVMLIPGAIFLVNHQIILAFLLIAYYILTIIFRVKLVNRIYNLTSLKSFISLLVTGFLTKIIIVIVSSILYMIIKFLFGINIEITGSTIFNVI